MPVLAESDLQIWYKFDRERGCRRNYKGYY
jgi:hypothetical protein